jgi:hypothetical protein
MTENPCVGGSIPPHTTKPLIKIRGFFIYVLRLYLLGPFLFKDLSKNLKTSPKRLPKLHRRTLRFAFKKLIKALRIPKPQIVGNFCNGKRSS